MSSTTKTVVVVSLAIAGSLGSVAVAPRLIAHEADPSRYTYHEDVRPIFVEHCADCHRPQGIGPMSLLEYQEAVPWANAVKMQVLERRMPPWLPEDGIGVFHHARTLSAEEIDVIVDWAVGLTPEGELSGDSPQNEEDELARRSGPDAAEPDLVLSPARDVVIVEDEYDKTTCVVVPTGLAEPRLVSSFEVRPTLPSVTRRATIRLGESCAPTSPPLATWLPGQGRFQLGEREGIALGEGATLAVELRYVKGWNDDGKRLVDRPTIALWYARSGRAVNMRRFESGSDSGTLDHAVTLIAIYPDLEPESDSEEPIFIEARRPDGTSLPLLSIEQFDSAWREKYVLESPIPLPSGTELRVTRGAVWLDFLMVAPEAAE
jgi:mono/diheme cytochrome c family protein